MNGRIISWTRSDLKWRAKQAFRKNYWSAVLVSLVLAIVLASGGKGAAQSGAGNVMNSDYSYQVNTYHSDGFSSYAGHMFGGSYSPWALIFALVGAGVVVAAALVGILLKIFVCNVFEVGGRSFYIENLYAVQRISFRILWKCSKDHVFQGSVYISLDLTVYYPGNHKVL